VNKWTRKQGWTTAIYNGSIDCFRIREPGAEKEKLTKTWRR